MKNLILIRSNLRKAKSQAVAIAVLILLASVMLNLWLMLAMDYKQNFDRYHDKLNAEHVTFVIADDNPDTQDHISQIIENNAECTEYCFDSAMLAVGSFPYNGGEINSNLVFIEKEDALSRNIGKIEITEDSGITDGIYLPMLYKTGDIDVGKTVTINIMEQEMEFTVCGFFNSLMTGSHNTGMCAIIAADSAYKKLQDAGCALTSTIFSIRIKDKNDSEDFLAALSETIAEKYPGTFYVSNSYTMVTSSRYVSQMICSSIIAAMAFLTLMITLIVMVSNIINFIQKNMRNLGALKAVGYTGAQLSSALIFQFLGVAAASCAMGIGLSYCVFPSINAMMIAQTGIPYMIRFLTLPAFISFVAICAAVVVTAALACRKIRITEPITALRNGVETHSFKRNFVPLDKANMGLSFALALKTMFSNTKQNVTVGITMLVVSLIVVFSGVMLKNVIIDSSSFIRLIIGETADSAININAENEDNFLQEAVQNELVEKVYLFNSTYVRHEGNSELMVNICRDFAESNNPDVICEGRFPKHENETAIAAKYAVEMGLKIGDEITLSASGNKADYIITGYTQVPNNLGKDALLTRAGYERIGELQNATYYINLREDTDVEKFNEEMTEKLDGVNMTVNVASVLQSSSEVYITLMTVIVIAILVLSVIIIAFVLYLLERSLLSDKKRDYGIQKALGFTTRQLITQTALCFMPSAVISMILGIIVSCFVINPLLSVFLGGIGIVKCMFEIPVGIIAAMGAGIIVVVFALACFMSGKVKKITPAELLADV